MIDNFTTDFDKNGKVGLTDLLHLKKNFGVGTTVEEGDLTGDGLIDEFVFFDHAISAKQVKGLYHAASNE